MWLYSHHIAQKALYYQLPLAVMKEWQTKHLELLAKRVVNHTGPETYSLVVISRVSRFGFSEKA